MQHNPTAATTPNVRMQARVRGQVDGHSVVSLSVCDVAVEDSVDGHVQHRHEHLGDGKGEDEGDEDGQDGGGDALWLHQSALDDEEGDDTSDCHDQAHAHDGEHIANLCPEEARRER